MLTLRVNPRNGDHSLAFRIHMMVFRIHRKVSRIRNLVPGIRKQVAGRCRGCGDGNSWRASSNSPLFELMVKH